MHWWNGDHWNGDGHASGMGPWWILIIVAIGLVLWFVSRRSRGQARQDSPEQGLKRRYAKGDIDRETYERILGDLRK